MENNNLIPDSVLIQKCKEGNWSFFEIIIERYSQILGKYLLYRVGDLMLAEDILQDTFMKTITAIKNNKYKEEGALKSWLYTLANNLFMDFKRKEKKLSHSVSISQSGSFEDNDEDGPKISIIDQGNNPEEIFIRNECPYEVAELINNLPRVQKEVVILRYYQNFQFDEIAEFTGVSINTALGRMRYALMNLRKQIAEITKG